MPRSKSKKLGLYPKALLIAGCLLASLFTLSSAAQASGPVAVGASHSCTVSGYGTVWCWGDNTDGQLGRTDGGLIPHQVLGLSGVSSVSAGDGFSCALKTDHTVWCWGDNGSGQLGNGKNLDSTEPVQVSGLSGVDDVRISGKTACAATSLGEAWCWGDNNYGQLGDGAQLDQSQPVQISGISDAKQVVPGANSVCALLTSGGIKCWGKGWYGQLGNGSSNDSFSPVDVTSITDATDLALGAGHACALLSDHSIKCWGRNLVGQLGNGDTTDVTTPQAVSGISNATQISLGQAYSCALLDDGSVKCWGLNSANLALGIGFGFGQLGDGSGTDSQVPVLVGSLSQAQFIQSGSNSSCALKGGQVWCWGDNTSGQLGTGSVSTSAQAAQTWDFPLSVADSTSPDTPSWNGSNLTDQNSATVDFTTSENGGSVQCRLDSGEWGACSLWDPAASSGQYGLNGLVEGEHTLQVRQIDISDNVSPAADFTLTVDQTAPLLPTITPVADLTNQADQTLSWTLAESGGSVQCRIDAGQWQDCSPQDGGAQGSFQTGALTDGLHSFHVRQTDPAGNTGQEASLEWTVDTQAPDMPILADAPALTKDNSPLFLFALDETGGTVECKLDDGEWGACTSIDEQAGSYQADQLTDGEHTLQVRQTDLAGNTSQPDSWTWTVDTQAPDAPQIDQPQNPTRNTEPTVTFNLSEAGGAVQCKLNDSGWGDCSLIDGTAGNYETNNLEDGLYNLQVRHTDPAGNTSQVSSVSWEVDTQAPKAPVIGKFQSPTQNTSPVFQLQLGESGGLVEYRLDSGEWTACDSQSEATASQALADLADGKHKIEFRHTDAVGNVSKTSTWFWTVDTQGPATATINPIASPSRLVKVSLGATLAEDGGSVQCKLDDEAWGPCTARVGNAITFQVRGLTDGEHSFQVRQTDVAGNIGDVANQTWTVDTTAPDAPQITPLTTPNNDANSILEFQIAEAGGSVQCKLDNKAWEACTSLEALNGTYDTGQMADGSHTLRVRQTDQAGNTSQAGSFTWTVDTVPPTPPVIAAVKTPNSLNSQTISFTLGQTVGTTQCRIDDGDWGSCSLVSGKSGNHATGVLSDGSHTLQVRQTDLADNTSLPGSRTWTIDTQAPDAPTMTSAPGSNTHISTATLAWTGETGASSWCQIDGKAWSTCTSPKTLLKLSPGSHSFAVRMVDPAGNIGQSQTTNWTYTEPPTPGVSQFDLTPESAALAGTVQTGPSGKTVYTTAKTLVYSLTFNRAVSGLAANDFSNRGSASKWTVQSVTGSGAGPYLITLSNPTGQEGSLDLSLNPKTVTSPEFGTLGPALQKVSDSLVILDKTAPAAPRLSGIPVNRTAATSLNISISAESGAKLSCRLDSGAWQDCTSPWAVQDLAEGVHTAQVRQADIAGNTGTAATGSWTVHILPPDAPTLIAKPMSSDTSKAVSVWFSGENKSTFQCRLDEAEWQSCTSPFAAQGLSDGAHLVEIKQTDELGGVSSAAQISWTTSLPDPPEAARSKITRSTNKLTCSLIGSAPAGTTISWRWFSAGIPAGSGNIHTIADDEWGKDMVCVAAIKNGTGSLGYQSSAWNENLPKPSFTLRTALNRSRRIAQVYMLTQIYGPMLSVGYQWTVGGVQAGTGNQHNWSSLDSGKIISCTVTLTNASGSTSSTYSFKA